MNDQTRLEALVVAIDASPRALRRDQCGDYIITGKLGHIFADALRHDMLRANHRSINADFLGFCFPAPNH